MNAPMRARPRRGRAQRLRSRDCRRAPTAAAPREYPRGCGCECLAVRRRELARALATEQAKAWFRGQGATTLGGTLADFAKRIEADYERWGKLFGRPASSQSNGL